MAWSAPLVAPQDYRVSWGLVSAGLTTWRAENGSSGGNAYPGGGAVSFSVSGLDAGTYRVWVRARYADGVQGAWAESDEVVVAAAAQDPVVEDPVVEDPVVEDPVVEDPVVEDPVVEDPVEQPQNTNETPEVLPTLREWTGGVGTFTLTASSRIVINSGSNTTSSTLHGITTDIQSTAANLREQFYLSTGLSLSIVSASTAQSGDILLTLLNSRNGTLGDEGYVLSIGNTIEISANTVTGIFYGRQTVLQIVAQSVDLRTLPRGTATDYPEKDHRAIMLDMGRKYWEMSHLRDTIRRMSWHKLNILHMHLTENDAFRLDSLNYPGLAPVGESYSKEQIRELEDLAKDHHVVIIPEIDMPGHAGAITRYYEQVNPGESIRFSCTRRDQEPSGGGSDWNINYANDDARQYAKDLLSEFVPWFDSAYVHIGADETSFDRNCPELIAYADIHTEGREGNVLPHFINAIREHVGTLGKEVHIWNGYERHGQRSALNTAVVVYYWSWWGGTSGISDFVNAGFDVVVTPMSTSVPLYLTPGKNNFPAESQMLNHTLNRNERVRGYQISVWADNRTDAPDEYFERQLTVPRAVLAERLWNGSDTSSSDMASFRSRLATTIPEPPESPLLWAHSGIRKDRWTLHSASSTDGRNVGSNVFDKRIETAWRSGSGGYPHELQIDLGNTYEISAFEYVPNFRRSGSTGHRVGVPQERVAGYELYVSSDPSNWGSAVVTGRFSGTENLAPAIEIVHLPTSATGRYVRLVATSALGSSSRATIAEISFFGHEVPDPPVSVADLDSSLLHWWKLDEGRGTSVENSQGDQDGTITGASWVTKPDGRNALSFDGNNDRIDFFSDGNARREGAWTASMWVKRKANVNSAALLTGGATSLKLQQWRDETRQRVGFTRHGRGDYTFDYSAPLNEWVHLTFVRNASTLNLYANGETAASSASAIDLPLHRFGERQSGRDDVNAEASDIRVYDTALTNEQVRNIFFDAALVAHWEFEEGSGITTNNSSWESDGTIGGSDSGVTWTTGQVGDHALAFAGSGGWVDVNDVSRTLGGDWTAMMWTKRLSNTDGSVLFGGSNGSVRLEQISSTDSGHKVGISSLGDTPTHHVFDYSAPLDTWVHLVLVRDGGSLMLYADGVLSDSISSAIDLPLSRLGGDTDGTKTLNAQLDDMRIYGAALTSDQIEELYRSEAPAVVDPPTPTDNVHVEAVASEVRNGDSARFRLVRSSPSGAPVVNVMVSAPTGTLDGSTVNKIEFDEGQSVKTVSVVTSIDSVVGSEITMTVQSGSGYDPGSNNTAISTIVARSTALEVSLADRNEAPTADAGADQTGVVMGATVTLAGSGTDPDAGDTLAYAWTQPEGVSVTLSGAATATATFDAPGGFTEDATLVFALTVTDAGGLSHQDQVSVTVEGPAPAAPEVSGASVFSVIEGSIAVGVLSATDADTEVADLVWSLVGGVDASRFSLSASGVLVFSAAKDFEDPDDADSDGTYELTVRVSDGQRAATGDVEVSLADRNEAPTADAGADQTGVVMGATVTLAGSGTDPDAGDTLAYAWTQPEGVSVTLSGAATATATFDAPGGFTEDATLVFALTVTDAGGLSHQDQVSVTVEGPAPAAPEVSGASVFSVIEGSIAVGVLSATDADTEVADLVWSLVGGVDASRFSLSASGVLVFSASKDFEDPDDADSDGTYELTVRVSDGQRAATGDVEVSLADRNEAPTADAGADQTGVVMGATVTLAGSGTDPDAGDTLAYAWTQPEGVSVTLSGAATATATFDAPGGFTEDATLVFALTVTDAGGLSHQDQVSVTVEGPAPAVEWGERLMDRDIVLGGSSIPSGLWSNGTDMWIITNWQRAEVSVYSLADGSLQPSDSLVLPGGNGYLSALWSDNTTLWAADFYGGVRAYRLSDGARVSSEDFDSAVMAAAGNLSPTGLWSNGNIMWVADYSAMKAFAYLLSDKTRVPARDIDLVGGGGAPINSFGIWSNGHTLLTASWLRGEIAAQALSDGQRQPDRDLDTSAIQTHNISGIWSNGEILWVVFDHVTRVYAFAIPGLD